MNRAMLLERLGREAVIAADGRLQALCTKLNRIQRNLFTISNPYDEDKLESDEAERQANAIRQRYSKEMGVE